MEKIYTPERRRIAGRVPTVVAALPALLAGFLALAAPLAPAPAAEPSAGAPASPDAERRLEEVRDRIRALSERLREARGEADREAERLRETERALARAARVLHEIRGELEAKRDALAGLTADRARRRADLAAHRHGLARQLRAAYAMGRQDHLRILLHQEDAGVISRVLTYHRYVSRARAARIERLRADLAALARLERAILLESRALEQLAARHAAAREALARQREARAAAVNALAAEIERGGRRLAVLEENERELERLLDGIRRALADIPATLADEEPFADRRGRLPWPTEGRIRHPFGTRRPPGDLRWQGVWIAARAGEPVRAISHGRVAYAEWLRGLGMLVILDHGGGYMSLYGHNRALLKEPGDWVAAGESIALVGDTGGLEAPGLYFEIRERGRPVDPARWCRRSVAALVSP